MEALVQQWVSVVIFPDQMEQLQKNILKKTLSQVVGKCIENIGYVIDVHEIVKVHDNNISPRNGNANFNVLCVLKVYQVHEGDIVDAKISTLVHDKGIYVEKEPLVLFAKWHPEMDTLYEGNTCKIKISRYRFEDNKIICIGDFVPSTGTTTTESTKSNEESMNESSGNSSNSCSGSSSAESESEN